MRQKPCESTVQHSWKQWLHQSQGVANACPIFLEKHHVSTIKWQRVLNIGEPAYSSNLFGIDYLHFLYDHLISYVAYVRLCRAAILVAGAGIRSPLHGAVVRPLVIREMCFRTFRPLPFYIFFTHLPLLQDLNRFSSECFEGTAHLSLQQSHTRCLKLWDIAFMFAISFNVNMSHCSPSTATSLHGLHTLAV